jgi:hypothetical protein
LAATCVLSRHGRACPGHLRTAAWGRMARIHPAMTVTEGPVRPIRSPPSAYPDAYGAWPGYPRLSRAHHRKSWVTGPSPVMTRDGALTARENALLTRENDLLTRGNALLTRGNAPITQGKAPMSRLNTPRSGVTRASRTPHATTSSSTRPSDKCTCRSQRAAKSRSCVISSSVVPIRRRNANSSSITASPVA